MRISQNIEDGTVTLGDVRVRLRPNLKLTMKYSGSPIRKKEGVKGLKRGSVALANGGMSTNKEALKIADKIPGGKGKYY